MKDNFTTRNHYVPQWYQRRFFESKDQTTFNYLDLDPGIIIHNKNYSSPRKELHSYGTGRSFKQDHLYTTYLGSEASDLIEKVFFGNIDKKGEIALPLFSNLSHSRKTADHFLDFSRYLCAQLFRTPKMLEIFSKTSNRNFNLSAMLMARELFLYNWTSSIWEIISCERTDTKFILSDAPVTTYNRKVYPASKESAVAGQAVIGRVGTRTLFPLGLDKCLIITPAEMIMKPKGDPLRMEDHNNYYKNTTFNLGNIIYGRQISENEVIAINYILKKQSKKFIASTRLEWLYPEKNMASTDWSRLGGEFFLQPDPRSVNPYELVRLTTQPPAITRTVSSRKWRNRAHNLAKSFQDSVLRWHILETGTQPRTPEEIVTSYRNLNPDNFIRITYESNMIEELKKWKNPYYKLFNH